MLASRVRYIEQGRIRAPLAKTFPRRELAAAQAELIDKRHTGNFVIII